MSRNKVFKKKKKYLMFLFHMQYSNNAAEMKTDNEMYIVFGNMTHEITSICTLKVLITKPCLYK